MIELKLEWLGYLVITVMVLLALLSLVVK